MAKSVQIWIPQSLMRRIKDVCDRRGESARQLTDRAIRREVSKLEKELRREES